MLLICQHPASNGRGKLMLSKQLNLPESEKLQTLRDLTRLKRPRHT